jgi:hypothetical protein
MREDSVVYVGVEAAKAKHAIAIAEGGRSGEVRYVGEIEATPAAVERFGRKLERKDPRLHFCYEAGPTGSGLSRHIVALGHRCEVVAPSLVPRRPGDHVKTNRRDAITLARLLRAGELSGIWGPDAVHEYGTSCVFGARQERICARSANNGSRFCSVTDGSSPAAEAGVRLTPAGWRRRSSTIQPCRSCSRIRLTPSRRPGDNGSGLMLSWPNSCQPGRWRRSCRPIKLCVACLSWLLSRSQARSAMVAGSTVHGN